MEYHGAMRHKQRRRLAYAAAQARAYVLWPAAMQPYRKL